MMQTWIEWLDLPRSPSTEIENAEKYAAKVFWEHCLAKYAREECSMQTCIMSLNVSKISTPFDVHCTMYMVLFVALTATVLVCVQLDK